MKLLLIGFLLVSCNVLKTLTDGQTDVGENFYKNCEDSSSGCIQKKQLESITIYMCTGTEFCYFDSETEAVTTIDSARSLVPPYIHANTKNYIYYVGTAGTLWKYDKSNQVVSDTTRVVGNQGNIIGFGDSGVYFADNSGPDILYRYDGSSATAHALVTFSSSFQLGVMKNHSGNTDRLFYCNSTGQLTEVLTSDMSSAAITIDPITDTAGNSFGHVPCYNFDPLTFYNDNFVSLESGKVIHYTFGTNHLDESHTGVTGGGLGINSLSGRYYAWSGAGPYSLHTYNTHNPSSMVSIENDYSWGVGGIFPPLDPGNGKLYYVRKNAGTSANRDIVEYDYNGGIYKVLVENFPGDIAYMTGGSKGLYFFSVLTGSIWKLDRVAETAEDLGLPFDVSSVKPTTVLKDEF